MTVLKKREMEKFRHMLLTKQKDLAESVQRAESSGREVNDEPSDLADAASSAYNKEFLFNKSNADRITLRQINDALARIERNRYGRCQSCGVHLEAKRLDIVPWARYCVQCQEKKEKGSLRD